ncbi:uncharacterized protein LOC132557213 [Ylistrum balloti]|uniref:uncharacterized protein LOC132557213 n=1 Tax=Ylistrum balloti TaxID=509963 RepID=UPI00290585B1|nr:uncharacterized protein LOC132557213 [Ylistrum balloti]
MSCYPAKYKIMESLGQSVRRKDLLPDAVPSIHASEPSSMSNITDTPPPPKRQRMAFTKRENARILSQHFQATELMEIDHDVDNGSNNTMVCGMESDNSTPHTPSGSTTALTRTYGCQVGLKKPARRSKKIQTSFKTHNQVCQTTSNECKSVAIQCDIIKPEQTSNTNMCEDHNLTFDHDGTEEDNGDMDDHSPQEDLLDSSFNASFQSEADEDVDSDSNIDDERDDGRDRKFLVYESELLKLFSACPRCSSPTFGHIQQLRGTAVKILQDCGFCSYTNVWKSQPMIGSIPAGNLLLSCAILFSGSLPSKSLRMFNFMNMATISCDTFLQHQRYFLQPAILQVWNDHQQCYLDSVIQENREIVLGGDGRADTPGHSAKYGSYTMMDLDESRVVDVQLVQSNEVKSSYHMEKEGLIRSVKTFNDAGITIQKIVTDRHVQILKWVRENMPKTKHCVDIWHVAKGLKKKLTAISKDKDCDALTPWIKSISNHLYWVAASTPSADPSLMMEKWQSVANHVQNIHEGHGSLFEKCCHGDLSGRERQKKWIKPATKVSERLDDVILSNQMKKDIPMLSTGQQTSSIEAYHSVINHFAPKMIGFSYHGMICRLQLAALHFNENRSKLQAVDKDGVLRYRLEFPKYKKGEHIVRKVKVHSTFDYVENLTEVVMSMAERSSLAKQRIPIPPTVPPPLCHDFLHPDMSDAIAGMHSRFSMNF